MQKFTKEKIQEAMELAKCVAKILNQVLGAESGADAVYQINRKQFKVIEGGKSKRNNIVAFPGKLNLENTRNFKNLVSVENETLMEVKTMKYAGKTISQRPDGRWWTRYRYNGKQYSIYAKTQKECLTKLKKALNIKEKEDKTAIPNQPCLANYYHSWLKIYKIPNCKTSTIRQKNNMFKNWIEKSEIARIPFVKLTAVSIQKFLSDCPYQRLRQQLYILIGDILKSAVKQDIIRKNPCDNVESPKYRPTEKPALKMNEEVRFVEKAKDSEYWLLYALMLYEGLRPSEAKALRQCDFEDRYIVVRHSLDEDGNLGSTKNYKVRRIPIFESFKHLAELVKGESTETIFKNPKKYTGKKEFSKIVKELGISVDMYSLRHTFATRCAERGVNPKQVQLWLGHSNVDVTLRYYTNISDEFERANIAKIDTHFDTHKEPKE